MRAEHHVKSDSQATPQMLKEFGAAIFAAQPKALPKGIVALRFDEQASISDAIILGTQFLNVLGAVPIKQAQVNDVDPDPGVSASINAMAAKGGQTLIFYLTDMTQLRRLDIEAANASWGRNLQDTVLLLSIRMP